MVKKYSNPCSRCGTERIVFKVWKEKLDNSTIINTEMICPNPACQKLVAADNKSRVDKYTALKKKSEQRALDRKVAMHAKKLKK